MSITNFIPEVWSNELLVNLQKAHVAAQAGIINRDYEGTISRYGDTVHINNLGAVTIDDYTANTDFVSGPETLSDGTRALTIDQAKYFNFQVDDIDAAQANPKVMAGAMQEAAYGLADVQDSYLLGLYGDAAVDLDPNTSVAVDDCYPTLVDLGVALDEANVPTFGRWAIVPSWFHGLLLQDDRFVGPGTSNGILFNGEVGTAAGFRILKSNNVAQTGSDDSVYHVIAGHPMAWSLAEQINSVEAYRPQARFADAVKGLHLWGAKVVRPAALVHVALTRPA